MYVYIMYVCIYVCVCIRACEYMHDHLNHRPIDWQIYPLLARLGRDKVVDRRRRPVWGGVDTCTCYRNISTPVRTGPSLFFISGAPQPWHLPPSHLQNTTQLGYRFTRQVGAWHVILYTRSFHSAPTVRIHVINTWLVKNTERKERRETCKNGIQNSDG